jgi:hypothetical protein
MSAIRVSIALVSAGMIARLAPLAGEVKDSFVVLTQWLALWPNETNDSIRGVVVNLARTRTALDRLDETLWRALKRGGGVLAGEAEAHCATLHALLNTDDVTRVLDEAAINRWNAEGRALLDRIVERPPTPPPPPPTPPPPPPPGRQVLNQTLRPRDPAAVEAFTRALGSRLTSLPEDEVDIDVVITPRRRST